VQEHEAAHVIALQTIITRRGGVPVTAGCYDWSSIIYPVQFLLVAAQLEYAGVSAYDGAANRLTDTGLQQIFASIAAVEARHAAYLNVVTGQNATNQDSQSGAVDLPVPPEQIILLAKALPFVVTVRQQLTGGCTDAPVSSSASSNNQSSSTGNSDAGIGSASFTGPAIVSALLAMLAAVASL
jgi:hypothetical protein